MAKHPRFELTADKSGKFRFTLSATNGQVVLTSQGYASKASCKAGIASVQKNAGNDASYERKEAANGKLFFNLLAANKQVVGTSQMYASKASLEAGIASVKNNAAKAAIEDSAPAA